MRKKDKSLEVNEYRINFIYKNPKDIHTRYFQSVSSNQIIENLNRVIGHDDYQILSIEKYNRWSDKWEQEQDEITK